MIDDTVRAGQAAPDSGVPGLPKFFHARRNLTACLDPILRMGEGARSRGLDRPLS